MRDTQPRRYLLAAVLIWIGGLTGAAAGWVVAFGLAALVGNVIGYGVIALALLSIGMGAICGAFGGSALAARRHGAEHAAVPATGVAASILLGLLGLLGQGASPPRSPWNTPIQVLIILWFVAAPVVIHIALTRPTLSSHPAGERRRPRAR